MSDHSDPQKNLKLIIRPVIDQTWTIKRIVSECCPRGWESVFKEAQEELDDISDILVDDEQQNGMWYPLKKDLFRAFTMTPLSKVKVVIVGQDPYHDDAYNGPRAVGLAFSVNRDDKLPSSLRNIYKELQQSILNFIEPIHGDLSEWATRGVLLLNMCLTVRPHQPGSHKQLWLGFINMVINSICEANPNCIFLLWGKEAQRIHRMLGNRVKVLIAAHPSGLSATKGFLGCGHFKMVNEILKDHNLEPIDWHITP